MQYAYKHAVDSLRDGLTEANEFQPMEFGGRHDLLVQAQGCMRAAFLIGSEKVLHYDRIPFLLCRLGEPGVRDRCIDQFNQVDEALHHPLSAHLLAHWSPFRPMVDQMGADGSGMSPELQTEVTALCSIPLDDTIAEGPHATMGRIKEHSRASTWAWSSSSLRLQQNIDDINTLPRALDCDIQELWNTWNSVIRPPLSTRKERMQALIRTPRRLVERRVYHMDHLLDFYPDMEDNVAEHHHGGDGGDDADKDDDDDKGGPRAIEDGGGDSASEGDQGDKESGDEDEGSIVAPPAESVLSRTDTNVWP